ncbi:MAG TPA: winged helix-turn-helix transcriptional regulator [Solirubrobacteraceae bacterium]|jgi:DNA-binding HxlR family transcriptional regulator
MLQRQYPDQNCSIARSLEVVGERWALLILRDAVLGSERFEEFQERGASSGQR